MLSRYVWRNPDQVLVVIWERIAISGLGLY
jgi:hypothetical protein